MDIKNIVLIIIGGLNLCLGLYVLLRSWKSYLCWTFFSLTVGASFWSVCLSLSNILNINSNIALFWSRMSYIGALIITASLFLFGYLFPLEFKIPKKLFYWSGIPILFIIFLLIWPSFIIQDLNLKDFGYDEIYNPFGYIIFSFVFLFYMAMGFYFMIKRYIISDGIHRKNLKMVLIGVGIASIFGTIFDLILPFGNYWKLNWLGPYFILIMIFFIARIIFRK